MRKLLLALIVFCNGIILNAQSTDPAGCVFEGSLYSDSSEVVIGLPFVLWIRDNGTGCQLAVQYATQTGNPFPAKPAVNIRLLDDYNDIIDQAGAGVVEFTQNSVEFAVNRTWVEAVYEGSSGGAIIVIRDGRTRFLTDESYAIIRARFIVCPPTYPPSYLINAENGLYVANDTTVRMGGFLIEPTTITTEGYNWMMIDTLTTASFGLDYVSPETGDTTIYFARRWGSIRHLMQMGRGYWSNNLTDTLNGLYSQIYHSWNNGDPNWSHLIFDPSNPNSASMWAQWYRDRVSIIVTEKTVNPNYTPNLLITPDQISIGVTEDGGPSPGTGVQMGASGYGTDTEFLFLRTRNVDDNTATNGQFLQLVDNMNGEAEWATIDLSGYLPIADTAAMLSKYIERGDTALMLTNYVTFGNLSGYPTGTGTADRLARWTGTNTLAAGNLSDNATRLQALLPWQFHSWTDAGRPTGVTGYTGYSTTGNGIEWYQGSRWAKALESTFNRGTSGYVPYFDANGQITENIGLRTTGSRLTVGNGSGAGIIDANSTSTGNIIVFNATANPGTGSSAALTFQFQNTNATNNKTQFVFGGNSSSRQFSFGSDPYGLGNNVFFLYHNGTGSNPMWVTSDGRMRLGRSTLASAGTTNPYSVTIDNTDGLGMARGTVAQRPTIVASTNPLRFQTDSTALEYGESVGTWRLLATREYARSLVSALPTTNIYISNGALSGNRTITGNNLNVTWDNVTAFQIQSGGVTPGATVLSDVYYSQRQNYNQAKSRYFIKYQTVDTRLITGTNRPNFVDIFEWSFGSGPLYEWDRYVSLDTTNNVFFSKSGSQDYPHFNRFVTRRPASGTTYQTTPRWAWVATASTENANANTIHTIWGRNDALVYMTLKDEGRFMLAPDSTFIFDPLDDVLKLSQYGTGTKEAADLSKTQSNYIASFATDGTVLDYPISSLPNGIYSGSGTLSQTTTRARIPDNGNLYFGQSFNSNADSAYWYIANYGDGERELAYGITDTASTGFAGATFYSDGAGEMNWEFETSGASGTTSVKAQDGTFSVITSGGNMSLSAGVANEVAVVGLLRAKQEAYYEINSTSSPQTFSSTYSDNYVNQGGTQASFTFLFPASPEDGQILMITWGNAISAVTLDGNGNTITGTAVTTAVAGTRRMFKFYASSNKWEKIF